MRRCDLVCYDSCDPLRLRQVHKTVKCFAEAWQFSFFFCILKLIDRVRLQTELEEQMNLKEDQSLVIDLGPDEENARAASNVIGHALPTAA